MNYYKYNTRLILYNIKKLKIKNKKIKIKYVCI